MQTTNIGSLDGIQITQVTELHDLESILEFFATTMQSRGYGESIHPGDFAWCYFYSQHTNQTPLFLIASNQNRIVALACIWPWKSSYNFCIEKGFDNPSLILKIVAFAEEELRKSGLEKVFTNCWRGNLTRQTCLISQGYEVSGYSRYYRPNLNDIPPIELPDGFRIESRRLSSLSTEQWIEGKNWGADFFRQISQQDVYDPDLDLTIYDENDRVVAYAMGMKHQATQIGIILEIVVSEENRRQGLASALIMQLVDTLQSMGMLEILCKVRSDNEEIRQCLESLFFHVEGIAEVWSKNLTEKVGDSNPIS